MKTTILKCLLSLFCFSFVLISNAQEPYFCVNQGAKLEYIKKCPAGEFLGSSYVVVLKVDQYMQSGDTLGTIIYTRNDFDEKMEPLTDVPMQFKMTCHNGALSFDTAQNMALIVRAMLGEDLSQEIDKQGYQKINKETNTEISIKVGKINMKISGGTSVLPSYIKPGDKLADLQSSFKVLLMRARFSSTERMVIKEDNITTEAGTYPCMVIQEKMSEKGMGTNKQTTVLTWYSRGIGAVRIETYDKGGKLETIEELTSLIM